MRQPLTIEVMARELARLNAVFPKYSDADFVQLARGYREALSDLDAEQVAGAVGLAIREEQRFPVPAKLREHSRAWGKANRITLLPAPFPTDDDVLCRVCGARPRLARLEGTHHRTGETFLFERMVGACDASRHPIGGWHVPLPPGFLSWI